MSYNKVEKLPARVASFKTFAKLGNTFFEKVQPKLSPSGEREGGFIILATLPTR